MSSNNTTSSDATTLMTRRRSSSRHSDVSSVFDSSPLPSAIDAELLQFKELFGKLKFSYLEQETKEKFLRAIMDDPPLVVEQVDIDALEERNRALKASLKGTKADVDAVREQLADSTMRVCEEYVQVKTDAEDAERMLREIEEMEVDLATLKDDQHDDTEQNLPLPDTLSRLSGYEQESASLQTTLTALRQESIPRKSARLDSLHEELSQLEAQRDNLEAFAQAAVRMRDAEHRQGRAEKENVGWWYRSLMTAQLGLLGVKRFDADPETGRVSIVCGTRTVDDIDDVDDLRIDMVIQDGKFLDAQVIGTNKLRIVDVLDDAKRRNDPVYFVEQIKILADR